MRSAGRVVIQAGVWEQMSFINHYFISHFVGAAIQHSVIEGGRHYERWSNLTLNLNTRISLLFLVTINSLLLAEKTIKSGFNKAVEGIIDNQAMRFWGAMILKRKEQINVSSISTTTSLLRAFDAGVTQHRDWRLAGGEKIS